MKTFDKNEETCDRFFRKSGRVIGSSVSGAIGSAKNGVLGSLMLAAAGNQVTNLASLTTIAKACALGGAIAIIPAMVAYSIVFNKEPSRMPNNLLDITEEAIRKATFAYVAAYLGAGILGIAASPVALASASIPLVFGLINFMTKLITDMTGVESLAPKMAM